MEDDLIDDDRESDADERARKNGASAIPVGTGGDVDYAAGLSASISRFTASL